MKYLDMKLECGKCERRYFHQSELKMHEKSAHEGMRFICSKKCPSKKTSIIATKYPSGSTQLKLTGIQIRPNLITNIRSI